MGEIDKRKSMTPRLRRINQLLFKEAAKYENIDKTTFYIKNDDDEDNVSALEVVIRHAGLKTASEILSKYGESLTLEYLADDMEVAVNHAFTQPELELEWCEVPRFGSCKIVKRAISDLQSMFGIHITFDNSIGFTKPAWWIASDNLGRLLKKDTDREWKPNEVVSQAEFYRVLAVWSCGSYYSPRYSFPQAVYTQNPAALMGFLQVYPHLKDQVNINGKSPVEHFNELVCQGDANASLCLAAIERGYRYGMRAPTIKFKIDYETDSHNWRDLSEYIKEVDQFLASEREGDNKDGEGVSILTAKKMWDVELTALKKTGREGRREIRRLRGDIILAAGMDREQFDRLLLESVPEKDRPKYRAALEQVSLKNPNHPLLQPAPPFLIDSHSQALSGSNGAKSGISPSIEAP